MRNWNYIYFQYELPSKKSFYSTYEELKRSIWDIFKLPEISFLQYLWGIETSLLV